MRGVIVVTDHDWFQFLAAQPSLEEVNFWRPSDTRTPRLLPGTPIIFKLRKNYGGWIVGCGVFAKHKVLPAWLAWDSFCVTNGAPTFEAMRARIERLRPRNSAPARTPGDYPIGCLMLSAPTFLERDDWVRSPSDWPDNVVQGMAYDLDSGEGARVWAELMARTNGRGMAAAGMNATGETQPRYGEAVLVRPRLGQGTFRIAVLDAYGSACAVTGEHSLPVLEAAHIRPFALEGPRDVTNGVLLRSDLHRLFDKGYVGVDPEYRFVVSSRLREDFSNGRSYYPHHGQLIQLPSGRFDQPDRAQLSWHLEHVFRG